MFAPFEREAVARAEERVGVGAALRIGSVGPPQLRRDVFGSAPGASAVRAARDVGALRIGEGRVPEVVAADEGADDLAFARYGQRRVAETLLAARADVRWRCCGVPRCRCLREDRPRCICVCRSRRAANRREASGSPECASCASRSRPERRADGGRAGFRGCPAREAPGCRCRCRSGARSGRRRCGRLRGRRRRRRPQDGGLPYRDSCARCGSGSARQRRGNGP